MPLPRAAPTRRGSWARAEFAREIGPRPRADRSWTSSAEPRSATRSSKGTGTRCAGRGARALACPPQNLIPPHAQSGLWWLMVADSGCASPPMRFSTLALAPRAPARIERDWNVLANVNHMWNIASRLEPLHDFILDSLVNRRQRLLLILPMLRPVPRIHLTQGQRVGPAAIPIITMPPLLLWSAPLLRFWHRGVGGVVGSA